MYQEACSRRTFSAAAVAILSHVSIPRKLSSAELDDSFSK